MPAIAEDLECPESKPAVAAVTIVRTKAELLALYKEQKAEKKPPDTQRRSQWYNEKLENRLKAVPKEDCLRAKSKGELEMPGASVGAKSISTTRQRIELRGSEAWGDENSLAESTTDSATRVSPEHFSYDLSSRGKARTKAEGRTVKTNPEL